MFLFERGFWLLFHQRDIIRTNTFLIFGILNGKLTCMIGSVKRIRKITNLGKERRLRGNSQFFLIRKYQKPLIFRDEPLFIIMSVKKIQFGAKKKYS